MAEISKIGRYEVRALIGRGASGSVYLAYDTLLERTVALKTYAEGVGISGDAASNFLREVKAASKLVHPNVVVTYDGGLENGVAFLAMELVEGVSLSKWLNEKGRPTPQEALAVLRAVANGLAHAHAQGIVHRDLKPANVLIPARGGLGDAKITDFGIAKVIGSELTRTSGLGPGTPTYMAPEQIQGKSIDARVDVFALGILAYQLFTGTRPFQGEAVAAILYSILSADPPPPSKLNASLPKALDAPIARALAKNPDERTPDVLTLVAEITAALQPAMHRSLLVPALVTLVAVLLGALAYQALTSGDFVGWRFGKPSPERPDEGAMPVAAATATATSVAPATRAPLAAATRAPRPLATRTASATPDATATPVATAAPTATATRVATPTPAATPTPVATLTPAATPTRVATPTPATIPTRVATPTAVMPSVPATLAPPRTRVPPRAAKPTPRPTRRPPAEAHPPARPGWTGMAALSVSSTPPGAQVSIDGVPRGTTPLELRDLPPRTVTITVKFRTLAPASRTVQLRPGGSHTVHFEIY